MQYSEVTDLPILDERDAEGDVARIFEEYKRQMQIPYIPNILMGLAPSPAALAIYWDLTKSLDDNATLPESLIYMILFSIASSKNAKYCIAGNELTCRTLGIDGDTINALVEDIDSVIPHRTQEIIKFALKVAQNPQGLVAQDYQRVRDSGVTDDEIVEIIMIAAIANYTNTLSEAIKVPVESRVSSALGAEV
jgi:uncharacterized peroxidase-related enzyme